MFAQWVSYLVILNIVDPTNFLFQREYLSVPLQTTSRGYSVAPLESFLSLPTPKVSSLRDMRMHFALP